MMMRLWLPVVLVVVLIAGLTAGGIALSLDQTDKVVEKGTKEAGTQESSDAANENPSDGELSDAEPQTKEEASQESTPEETQEVSQADYSGEQAAFDEFISNLDEAVAANRDYLASQSEDLTRTVTELKSYERSHLTDSQVKTYDLLLDALNLQVEGMQYESVAAAASGVPLYTLEGGADYYNYLLRKCSGIDGTWEEFHAMLAAEVNENYQALNAMLTADSTLQIGAASFTKQQPDEAYAYDTVSASSSALKKNLVCNGLVNGWVEFGIIRAYQGDAALDEALRNYLIASTRMTYALYGVADVSVHAGGWGEAEVTQLCSQYFGEAGGSSYGSNVYQMVLKNPGRYAAAAAGYLQILQIESALSQQMGENYSEAALLDLLFNQGPANFRVMKTWIGL